MCTKVEVGIITILLYKSLVWLVWLKKKKQKRKKKRERERGKNEADVVDANVVICLSGTHLQTTFKT